ncbi:MAG: hypothetical protein AAF366_11470 [Pseudomonadota bacterium]
MAKAILPAGLLVLTGLTACNVPEPSPAPEATAPLGNEEFLSSGDADEVPTSAQDAVGI